MKHTTKRTNPPKRENKFAALAPADSVSEVGSKATSDTKRASKPRVYRVGSIDFRGCSDFKSHWTYAEDGTGTHKSGHEMWQDMMPGHSAKDTCEKKALEYKAKHMEHLELSSNYVLEGILTKGIKGHRADGERILKVFKLHYSLTADESALLRKDFPDVYFVTGFGSHDHPVAHTRTRLNSDRLYASLRRGTPESPAVYIDMHGNPKANASANARDNTRVIKTTVERVTPKDFLRAAEKWGDWETDANVIEATDRDWMQASGSKADFATGVVGFTSIHTLYYYEKRFLAELLARNKGSMVHALVHRFPENSGTLNNGEQRYIKKETSAGLTFVAQTNVLTGERYSHPDIEWLFQQSSWTDGTNGLAWTINKACQDSFYVKMTACTPAAVDMDLFSFNPKPKRDHAVEQIKADGQVTVCVGGQNLDLEVTAPKSFKDLRMLVSGKARTAQQYKEHLATTKRKMKANSEDDGSPAQLALATFLVDFDTDRAITSQALQDNREAILDMKNMLEGHAPRSARNIIDKFLVVGVLAAGMVGGKTGKDVSGLVRVARELLASNGSTTSV